jgi:hypothetical protein
MILSWSTFLITTLEKDTQGLLIKFVADRDLEELIHSLTFDIRPSYPVTSSTKSLHKQKHWTQVEK